MPRPYTINAHDPAQSVAGVLPQQWVGIHLRLRNRQQNPEDLGGRGLPVLRGFRPGGVAAVPDQVLPPLRFPRELEQPFAQDRRAVDRDQRLWRREDASADRVDQAQRRGASGRLFVQRLRLDQIDLGEAEEGEIVAIVLGDVARIHRELHDAGALVLVRRRGITDRVREDQWYAPGAARRLRTLAHGRPRFLIHLRSLQEDLPPHVGAIDGATGFRQRREAVPRLGAELRVVQ